MFGAKPHLMKIEDPSALEGLPQLNDIFKRRIYNDNESDRMTSLNFLNPAQSISALGGYSTQRAGGLKRDKLF